MTSLFQIAIEHRAMYDRLLDLDLDDQTFADTLEGESYPLEVKAQNCCYAIRTCDFELAAVNSEIDRLLEIQSRVAKRQDAIRKYVKLCMEVSNTSKISAGTFALSLQNNPPSVDIFEPALIPADYMRTPEPKPPVAAPDKKLIAQAIKDGFDVQGARLVTSQRLVIK